MKTEKCVFCKQPIIGYGNNAEPIRHGRCCDYCDATIVIPGRIAILLNNRNQDQRRKETNGK